MPSWDPEAERTASCRDFQRFSARPSSGGGRGASTISWSSPLSLWVARPEASCSSAHRQVWRGPGRAGRPAYAQLNGTASGGCCGCGAGAGTDAGAALGDEQAGALQPADGWRQQLPAGQDVLDRLSLLLSSRELLGHALDCVAEEASLGHRALEEPNFVDIPMSTRHSQVTLLDHKCGHRTTQRPRWPTSLARGQKWYKALSELLDRDHPRACPPVLLAWRTCSNAVAQVVGSFSTGHINIAGQTRRVPTGPEEEARFTLPGGGGIRTQRHRSRPLHRGGPVYPLAAPPPRVVREEELAGQFLAVKCAILNLVSSPCTSGKRGTGAGCWEPAQTTSRNQSSNLEGSGHGGSLHSSPTLSAARESIAVILDPTQALLLP